MTSGAAAIQIAPLILAISVFLSLAWGVYLVYTIQDYRRVRGNPDRKRGDLVSAFRRFIVVFSLWTICFAYLFRTAIVLAGFGETLAGQVTFFAMLAPNVIGSIFTVISLRYD